MASIIGKKKGSDKMPVFMQYKTAKNADKIFLTKTKKALGVVKNNVVKFYPATNYNFGVCYEARAQIQGMKFNE